MPANEPNPQTAPHGQIRLGIAAITGDRSDRPRFLSTESKLDSKVLCFLFAYARAKSIRNSIPALPTFLVPSFVFDQISESRKLSKNSRPCQMFQLFHRRKL
jgi:hypothetical protein